jgi:hypothetical protein
MAAEVSPELITHQIASNNDTVEIHEFFVDFSHHGLVGVEVKLILFHLCFLEILEPIIKLIKLSCKHLE